MKVRTEKRSFVDEKTNAPVEFEQVFLVFDNGEEVAIKSSFKSDNRLFHFLVNDEIRKGRED